MPGHGGGSFGGGGGGSRGGGGFGGGPRPGGFGGGGNHGGFGGPRPGGRPNGPGGFGPPHRPPHRGGFFWGRPRGYWGPRYYGPRGCGCGGFMISAFVLFVIAGMVLISALGGLFVTGPSHPDTDDQEQLNEKEYLEQNYPGIVQDKLPANQCQAVDFWLQDPEGILKDDNLVIAALKDFYAMTGVQPCLLMLSSIDGNSQPKTSEVEQYALDRYFEYFGLGEDKDSDGEEDCDEGHVLFLYMPYVYGSYEYYAYYLPGLNAEACFTKSAFQYWMDTLDLCRDEYSTLDEAIASAFRTTAKAVTGEFSQDVVVTEPEGTMSSDASVLSGTGVLLIVVAGLLIVVGVVLIVRGRRRSSSKWEKDSYRAEKQEQGQNQGQNHDYQDFNDGF